jgi:hypothetical protein
MVKQRLICDWLLCFRHANQNNANLPKLLQLATDINLERFIQQRNSKEQGNVPE